MLKAILLNTDNIEKILPESDITRSELEDMIHYQGEEVLVFVPHIEAPDRPGDRIWATIPMAAFQEFFEPVDEAKLKTEFVSVKLSQGI